MSSYGACLSCFASLMKAGCLGGEQDRCVALASLAGLKAYHEYYSPLLIPAP